ncbi:MAG TPA: hypothetical protein DIU09_10685 [Hyphomonadaceae bacterium]|nr:hypothetical protein AEM38_13075 [Hyphomonadaceae bacterium UKL13-1]HCP65041.1 hypothetical protein [Hyphomonadaceae bacterium]
MNSIEIDVAALFKEDPFAAHYNLERLTSWSLSCDIDWAPDFAVEDLLCLVESFDIPLTAFATHKSDLLQRPPGWLEVGLHPDNTRPHAEHGLKRKVLDLLDLYPDAKGLRAHRNFFGQNIAQMTAEAGLTYDVSVLNWGMPFCQGQFDQYGLARLSYCWEDGVHADLNKPWDLSHVPFNGPGLKIFNVHPIFIYLNCPDDGYRRDVTKGYRNLQDAPFSILKNQVYQGYGARNFLIDILKSMKARQAKAVRLDKLVAEARGAR